MHTEKEQLKEWNNHIRTPLIFPSEKHTFASPGFPFPEGKDYVDCKQQCCRLWKHVDILSVFSSTHVSLLSLSLKKITPLLQKHVEGTCRWLRLCSSKWKNEPQMSLCWHCPKQQETLSQLKISMFRQAAQGWYFTPARIFLLADASEVVSACGRQTKPKVYGGFSDFQFVSFTDVSLQTVWIILWPKRKASCFQASLSITSCYSLKTRGKKVH